MANTASARGADARGAGTSCPLTQRAVRMAQLLDSATDCAAGDVGLTRADADVLLALLNAAAHRMRPTELAARCGLSSGGTSNIIHRLAQAGYANREANLDDGRSSWVQLTDEGERLAGRVAGSAAERRARLFDRLPEGVADRLTELLEIALDHVEEYLAHPNAAHGQGARACPDPSRAPRLG